MTLSEKYLVTSDIDTYFVNKDTGQPLSNGTVRFFRDSVRNVPKPVYQLSGAPPTYNYVSLGSTITLSNAGNAQDANGNNIVLYYKPYSIDPGSQLEVVDLYYIECYDQNGVLQFTREAWPNVPDDSAASTTGKESVTNQLSNPQFTNVFISDGIDTVINLTSAIKQSIPIAPDWDLIVTGTGTVTLNREKLSGNLNLKTNPPYSLRVVTSTGISQCLLNQRFYKNSGLWASSTSQNLYLCGSFLARNNLNAPTNMIMYYSEPTPGYVPQPIFSGSFQSLFVFASGCSAATIPLSSNNTTSDYVDIYVDIPVNRDISVTSLNVYSSLVTTTVPSFSLDSSNRNQAYQGDWYIPRLNQKDLSSYLVGWDFSMNPYQFSKPSPNSNEIPANNAADYIFDQTIAFNSTALSSNVWQYSLNPSIGALSLLKRSNTGAIALMQYIDKSVINNMVKKPGNLSVNLDCVSYTTDNVDCRARVYIATNVNPPSILPAKLGDLNPDGTFTITDANWKEVPNKRGNQQYKLENSIDLGHHDIPINGFEVTENIQFIQYACIIVTFTDIPFNKSILVNSISLVNGDIPCRPPKLTANETLKQCQYFYRKSFNPGVFPANNVTLGNGESYGLQQRGGPGAGNTGIIVRFDSPMVKNPSVVFYNPLADNSFIWNLDRPATFENWTSTSATRITKQGFIASGEAPLASSANDLNTVNWTADARLGKV